MHLRFATSHSLCQKVYMWKQKQTYTVKINTTELAILYPSQNRSVCLIYTSCLFHAPLSKVRKIEDNYYKLNLADYIWTKIKISNNYINSLKWISIDSLLMKMQKLTIKYSCYAIHEVLLIYMAHNRGDNCKQKQVFFFFFYLK